MNLLIRSFHAPSSCQLSTTTGRWFRRPPDRSPACFLLAFSLPGGAPDTPTSLTDKAPDSLRSQENAALLLRPVFLQNKRFEWGRADNQTKVCACCRCVPLRLAAPSWRPHTFSLLCFFSSVSFVTLLLPGTS